MSVAYTIACTECGASATARVVARMSVRLVELLPDGWRSDDDAPDGRRRYHCAACVRGGR